MPVFTKGDTSVLFVHIPKTGGTSIEQLFLSAGWKRRYFLSKRSNEEDRKHYELLRSPPQHMSADQLQSMFRLDRFDVVFTIVRNPISRFRSEYVMRKLGGSGGVVDAKSVERWADRQFKLYSSNPNVLDNHIRPQVDFLLPGSGIFQLEGGLDGAVATLNEQYDLDLPMTVEHAMDSRKVTGGRSSSSVEVSDSLLAKLRAMYSEDFQAFNY